MTPEGITRRLTAILSADVKDYTRLMRQDDVGTVCTLTACKEAMEILIRRYRGRAVDAADDNALSRFDSILDAVNCAAEMQRELSKPNAELPYHRRMEFRMGVSLEDILVENFDSHDMPGGCTVQWVSVAETLSMGIPGQGKGNCKKTIHAYSVQRLPQCQLSLGPRPSG